MADPTLSIIIPTLNEAEYCKPLFSQLARLGIDKEVIVVDGESQDQTLFIAREFGFATTKSEPGRARQLAKGAALAMGDFLLFLHADVVLDAKVEEVLQKAIDNQVSLASFWVNFDHRSWFLKSNALFSRLKWPAFHFGDQGLWISKVLYRDCGGFNPDDLIMEGQLIYRRAYKLSNAQKFNIPLKISARKYENFGIYRLQFYFYKLWLLHQMGVPNAKLAAKYQKFLASKKPDDI